jgi:hypothetical protein
VQGKSTQNQINKQLKPLCKFHRTLSVRELENTVWVQFGLENLESFGPVTQDRYQDVFLQQSTPKSQQQAHSGKLKSDCRHRQNTKTKNWKATALKSLLLGQELKWSTNTRMAALISSTAKIELTSRPMLDRKFPWHGVLRAENL